MQIQRINNWDNPIYNRLKEASQNQKKEKVEERKSVAVEKSSNQIIKNLQRLKEDFKEQKIELQETEMESEIQQMRLIEKEKEALEKQNKLEEKNKKDESINTKNRIKFNENSDGVIVEDSLKKLISARHKLRNVNDFGKTKAAMEVEKGYLELSGNENSFVNKQYTKLTKGIKGIENRILYEVGKVNKEVNKEVNNNYKDKEAFKDDSSEE